MMAQNIFNGPHFPLPLVYIHIIVPATYPYRHLHEPGVDPSIRGDGRSARVSVDGRQWPMWLVEDGTVVVDVLVGAPGRRAEWRRGNWGGGGEETATPLISHEAWHRKSVFVLTRMLLSDEITALIVTTVQGWLWTVAVLKGCTNEKSTSHGWVGAHTHWASQPVNVWMASGARTTRTKPMSSTAEFPWEADYKWLKFLCRRWVQGVSRETPHFGAGKLRKHFRFF